MVAQVYREELCDLLVDHMAKGFSFNSFAAIAEVSRQALYGWARKHPEFQQAREQGTAKALRLYEGMMLKGMSGHIPGFKASACQWMMECRFDEYSPVREDKGITILNSNAYDPKKLLEMAMEARRMKVENEQKRIGGDIPDED